MTLWDLFLGARKDEVGEMVKVVYSLVQFKQMYT